MGFVLTILGIVAWMLIRYRSGRELSIPLVALPLGAVVLLGYVLSTRSPVTAIAIEKVSVTLPIVLLLLLVTDSLFGWWKVDTWENALVSLAILFCFLEFVLAFFWISGWWQASGAALSLPPVGYRPSGLFLGHANVFAGYLNLVIPIAIVRSTTSNSKRDRVLWYLAIATFLLMQVLASSRGAWLAGIAAILTTLGILFVRGVDTGGISAAIRRNSIKLVSVVGALLLITVLVLIAAEISPGRAPLLLARSGIWEPAWEIIRTSPWIGHGPASFSSLFAIQNQIPPGFATSHAHNVVLQTWAELGLLGLLLLLLTGAFLIVAFVSAWGKEFSPRLAAYAGIGIGVLVHNQLDYLFEPPGYLLGVMVIIGLLYHHASSSQIILLSRGSATAAIGLALIPFIGTVALGGRGAQEYWRGVEAGRSGDWQAASDQICRASVLKQTVPLYDFQCGLALAYAAEEYNDPSMLILASEALESGLRVDPNWPIHHANLGAIQWGLGERERALVSMRRAAELAPWNARISINLGWMREQLGDPDHAAQAFQRAILSNPWVQYSRPLTPENSRVGSFREQEKSAIGTFREAGHYLYASESLLAGLDGWAALQEGDLVSAARHFAFSYDAEPGSAIALAGSAAVSQAQGNPAGASKLIDRALWLSSGSADVSFLAGWIALDQGDESNAIRHFEDAARSNMRFSESQPYYARTFLRYFLEQDAVPQLVGLGVPSLSAEDMQDIIVLLGEYDRRDLVTQLGWHSLRIASE